ncbi:SDR family oxidoreductase [Paenibacillus filicis]|uniref:SDR family oxidoreductase n=2 Tax=Paenibacillus gyeongsangnamensis TaxID=3388067 RepID=A0ABT4QEU9_9BACL|nr:SDR family oxidoreductase [Paenibacillus filicis]MCZ8515403.1 SDR family oxidoreductase [Paenibacillus filicis]
MSLEGKVAVVTGGARGIGASASKLLASRGAKVIVNYFSNEEAAEQVVKDIRSAGGEAAAIQGDVRDPEQVSALISRTKEAFGCRIDIMVSNANMRFAMKSFQAMTWEEFSQKLNDELKAAFEITKAVIPAMIEQQYGRLIYISSGLGKSPSGNFIAHGTAKSGLDSFVKYIAQEMGPYGITANVVAPGLVETEATVHMSEQAKQGIIGFTPLRRIAQPEDVARVISFLASDDSEFVTGSYTPVNGGMSME